MSNSHFLLLRETAESTELTPPTSPPPLRTSLPPPLRNTSSQAIVEAYMEDPGNTKYIFKRRHYWDITDLQMKKVWNSNGSSRMTDLAFLTRRSAVDRVRRELPNLNRDLTPLNLKGRGPTDFLTPQVWDSLCDQWNEEEEQKRFARAKNNREKGSNIKHSCGSILIGKHRLNLEWEGENKRKVSDFKMYEKTHLQKGTTAFIDERSRNINREYRERTCYSDPAPGMDPPPFDFETWKELTGGPKKGRCYGFGSSQSGGFFYYQGSNSSVSSYAIESENRFADLTKEIEELRAENARIQEDARRREEENQRSLEETRRRTQDLESVVCEML